MYEFPVFSLNDWLNITLRLTLALVIGGVVGWNRQLSGKPAGLRTHMLVSFGSAIFVLVALQPDFRNPSNTYSSDSLSRVIQGISTGIGFLGAGEILRQSDTVSGKIKVRGLTSAAAIWVSAALGIAIGAGLWPISLIGTLLTVLTLGLVKKLEQRMEKNKGSDN